MLPGLRCSTYVSTNSTKTHMFRPTRLKMAMFRPTGLKLAMFRPNRPKKKRIRQCLTQVSCVSTDSTQIGYAFLTDSTERKCVRHSLTQKGCFDRLHRIKNMFDCVRLKCAMFRPTRLKKNSVRLCSSQESYVSTNATKENCVRPKSAMFRPTRPKKNCVQLRSTQECYGSTESIE